MAHIIDANTNQVKQPFIVDVSAFKKSAEIDNTKIIEDVKKRATVFSKHFMKK